MIGEHSLFRLMINETVVRLTLKLRGAYGPLTSRCSNRTEGVYRRQLSTIIAANFTRVSSDASKFQFDSCIFR